MKTMARLRLSAYYLLVATVNCVLSHAPTFTLRAIILKALGWKIGKGVAIHRGLRITSLSKPCSIGNHSVINRNVLLDNRQWITIEDNVSISQGCSVYTLGHDIDSPYFSGKGAGVTICSRAVLFSAVSIMPGVSIGKGGVALPQAVVTRNIPPYGIAGGNPAIIKRYRNSDLKYTLDHRIWFGI